CVPSQGRAVLVHAHDRRVDRRHPVQLATLMRQGLHFLEHTHPDALLGPPVEVLVDRVPVSEPLRDVPPRRTGPVPPRGRLDYRTTLDRRATGCLRKREQRANHSPGLIGDLSAHHITRLTRTPYATL